MPFEWVFYVGWLRFFGLKYTPKEPHGMIKYSITYLG